MSKKTPKHPYWMSAFKAQMLDKPSVVDEPYCAVCGKPATNKHHVIPKGMGGVSAELEKRIPKIRLCGMGNADGCHGDVHAKLLHLYWDDDYCGGSWMMYRSIQPVDDKLCWELRHDEYTVLPGWYMQQLYGKPIGGSK